MVVFFDMHRFQDKRKVDMNPQTLTLCTYIYTLYIEKLAIFAIFSSSELKENRKYTSDTYKSIVFQVPLTEPYTLIPESLRLKYFQSFPEQNIRQITTGSGLGSLALICFYIDMYA